MNDVLSEKLDSVSQYTRRSCVIVEGIPVSNGESIEDIEKLAVNAVVKLGFTKENVENEMDKAHRVGPIYEGNQKVIIKFRSHKFNAKVYKERKSCDNNPIKFRPSLTKRRENLLS